MFAVKVISAVVCNCYNVLNMPSIFTFHISHTTWGIIDHSWKPNVLASYTINYVMLNSNEPVKVAHLQKLANQSMLSGALVIEMVNNSFSERRKNFGRLKKHEMFW